MKRIFRYFPLPVKLILIAFFPVIFMLLLTYQLYEQKKQSIALLRDFHKEIDHTQNLLNLVQEVQTELRLSYISLRKKDSMEALARQWKKTDSCILVARRSADPAQNRFTEYTFLDELPAMRNRIRLGSVTPAEITPEYINTIFRLNSLENNRVAARRSLLSVRKLIGTQKKLSQMMGYYNIIRLNIYNTFSSGINLHGTLLGLKGAYTIYKSYEKEFELTADPLSKKELATLRNKPSARLVENYMDHIFTHYSVPISFSAEQWWELTDNYNEDLKGIRDRLRDKARINLLDVMDKEQKAMDRYILFMIITIAFILLITNYTIFTITSMLKEIRIAARRISSGFTGISFNKFPRDAIGSLARSIKYLDKNNRLLAKAAEAIGKGDFNTEVLPRGPHDLLGNAILHMKEDLTRYTSELRRQQHELTKAVLNGQEKERARLGLELHDNINQLLTAAKLYVSHMQRMPEERDQLMGKTKEIIQMAIEEIRKLSKTLVQPALQINNLNNSINELAKDMLIGTGISFTFNTIHIDDKLISDEMKITIYRVVQEQLNNIIKYADANIVIVSIEQEGNYLRLAIQDDGRGFDTTKARKGIGLSNIFSRAEIFNGNVEIESAPWQGCKLKVELYAPALVA